MNKTTTVAIVTLVIGLGVGYALGGLTVGGVVKSTVVQTNLSSGQTLGKYADITLVSEGYEGGALGPNGKTHDTIMPANFTIYVGQLVNLTVINYDENPHSITSTDLGINLRFNGAKDVGVPSVTHFQFVATKAGLFRWWCALPCDAKQDYWAMTPGSDGGVGQLGFMAGYVTVLSG